METIIITPGNERQSNLVKSMLKERQHYKVVRKIVFVRGNIILKHKYPKI